MWLVLEHKRLDRKFRSIPHEIRQRYETWKSIVRNSGPTGLKAIRGFRDEQLTGQWKGYRSSRLSHKYRVIYAIEAEKVMVWVVDLTPHDYRRK